MHHLPAIPSLLHSLGKLDNQRDSLSRFRLRLHRSHIPSNITAESISPSAPPKTLTISLNQIVDQQLRTDATALRVVQHEFVQMVE